MRKLIASVAVVAGLLAPAQVASATSPAPVVGTRQCPAPYVGWIVYYFDPLTGEQVDFVALCIEVGE